MKTSQIKLKTSLKPYPEYKDSGIDWIGEIPKDWGVDILQRLFSKVKRPGFENKELLSVYRDRGVIIKSSRTDNHNKPSEDLSAYQLVEKGDLAINKMKAWQGSVAISNFEGIVSPAYYVCRPLSKNSSNFLHYLLRSGIYIKQYERNSGGVRNNQWDLSYERFRKLEAILPSIETQEKIAVYLDEKTELIDQIVEKKKKLIELLKEKRTAIINQAVTKGLDPNAELVDSGIDWIGKIPKDWRIEKLKFLSKVQASNVDKLTEDGLPGVLLCNYVDVYKNECIDASLNFMKSTASKDQIRKVGLRQGDILLTKDSETPDDIGVPAIVTEDIKDLVSGYHLYVVHPKKHSIDSKFLFRYFHSKFIRTYFELHSNGITRFGLGSAAVDSAKILLPGLSDQIRIASYLDEKTKLVDKSIDLIKVSVEKLKEFKVSLISGTITGKVMIK